MLIRPLGLFLLLGISILSIQAEVISTYFEMEQARKAGKKESEKSLNSFASD
jgi:hypothetical protein